MKANLPALLPQALRAQILDGTWTMESSGSLPWNDGIIDAKMKGTHVVFITFVPLIGACLLGCMLIKDTVLKGDEKPKPKESADPSDPKV